MKNLLVVIDYQNDFVTGALANEAAVPLESKIDAQVRAALAQGDCVIFTRDTHDENYLQTREGKFLPVPHCVRGTHGWRLYGALAAYEQPGVQPVAVVDKPVFGSTALPAEAQRLCGGAPQRITLCGVVTDICVISNAVLLHSAFPEAEITVRSDLCAGLTPQKHAAALDIMRGLGYNVTEG